MTPRNAVDLLLAVLDAPATRTHHHERARILTNTSHIDCKCLDNQRKSQLSTKQGLAGLPVLMESGFSGDDARYASIRKVTEKHEIFSRGDIAPQGE